MSYFFPLKLDRSFLEVMIVGIIYSISLIPCSGSLRLRPACCQTRCRNKCVDGMVTLGNYSHSLGGRGWGKACGQQFSAPPWDWWEEEGDEKTEPCISAERPWMSACPPRSSFYRASGLEGGRGGKGRGGSGQHKSFRLCWIWKRENIWKCLWKSFLMSGFVKNNSKLWIPWWCSWGKHRRFHLCPYAPVAAGGLFPLVNSSGSFLDPPPSSGTTYFS